MDLSVHFCGLTFKNPTVLASGIVGITCSSLKRMLKNGAGAVTTKSIWLKAHKGHRNPTMFGTEHYFINAVGLPDGGLEKAKQEIGPLIAQSKDPIIVNIVGGRKQDFIEIAKGIMEIKPQILELNISCPNVEDDFGRPFACVEKDAAELTNKVKSIVGNIPVIVKLSPNVENIKGIARACEEAGADGNNMGNTFGPGLVINIETGRPIVSNKVGGVSGPGLKPLVVKNIWDLYQAVKIPIIGTGSVLTGEDAIELIMAGASLVGIGTAVFYRGEAVFEKITREITKWCESNKVKKVAHLIGSAHNKSSDANQ